MESYRAKKEPAGKCKYVRLEVGHRVYTPTRIKTLNYMLLSEHRMCSARQHTVNIHTYYIEHKQNVPPAGILPHCFGLRPVCSSGERPTSCSSTETAPLMTFIGESGRVCLHRTLEVQTDFT